MSATKTCSTMARTSFWAKWTKQHPNHNIQIKDVKAEKATITSESLMQNKLICTNKTSPSFERITDREKTASEKIPI